MEKTIETHPVQTPRRGWDKQGRCPKVVTMAAYEVYSYLYGDQRALITEDCRGGFCTGELIAFLYAKSFPKSEWRQRVDEAFKGAENL